MTKYFIGFLAGIIGGIFVLGLASSFKFNIFLKSDLNDQVLVTELVPIPTLTPTPFDFWQKIVANSSLSTVAIQSFQGNVLKKQGSGIILSSDGLIITTIDVVVGKKVQVFFEDRIIQATVIKKDIINNLALIKTEEGNFNVSGLDNPDSYESGQDYILAGKLLDLSKITIFSQKALVNYVLDNKIVLDSQPNDFINGAKAFNSDGKMIGMSYLKGDKVYLVKSSIINELYNNYLTK